MRPKTLDEVVGQAHLVGQGAPMRVLIEQDRLGSAILWGPAGTGKTTLARIVADASAKAFVPLSAVAAGVRDVREELEKARGRLGEHGRGTILFIDEVHRFNKAQQDVLLPAVEDGLVVLIGATTENPYFEVNAPLLSRSTLWRLEPLSDDDIVTLLERGAALEEVKVAEDAMQALVAAAGGDARAALTTLEVAAALAATERDDVRADAPAETVVTRAHVAASRSGRIFHQGVDEHYDQISAFIKSVRGSDPDAGLYWLARMLDAGEDPRFLARRMVILASEDVGLADPIALVVADAAARAVEFVGLPEAALNLAEATVYLATAPKSNRVTVALGRAREDARGHERGDVPRHLRDAHYRGATSLGHGEGYRYPHDEPGAWTEQQYRPDGLESRVYYEPSERGYEASLGGSAGVQKDAREGVDAPAPAHDGEKPPRGGGEQRPPRQDERKHQRQNRAK